MESLALPAAERGEVFLREFVVSLPGGGCPAPEHGTDSVRVVQVEHRGLSLGVGGPLAVGVLGVALDLGGPALVALDQHGGGPARPRHGRGVVVGHARQHFLGWFCIGQDVVFGTSAAAETGQADRRGHQVEEPPPIDPAVEELAHRPGKLPLHPVAELRGVGQLVEAAPVGLARGQVHFLENRQRTMSHRWHPAQCSGARIRD